MEHLPGIAIDRASIVAQSARRGIEGEVIAAFIGRLIVLPPDRMGAEMGQKQRPHPAMGDDREVARAFG